MSGAGEDKKHLRSLHPTVKPAIMVRDALLDCTGRGDIVLDLFAGSGTILIAAEMAKRKARAIELEPRYCDVGIGRWEAFAGKQARLDSTGQTFAEVRAARATITNAGGI
jgi:DNA modification methylase